MANLLQVNLCLAHQAVFSENNPHSKGKRMSSFGLVTPKGFLLGRLHLNIIVSKQVPCSTLCGSLFLWIFNWKSRRGMSCGFLHHTLSLPWGFFCSARSLWDEEAATAFAKLQYFLALPEPQTQTWGNSLWEYSSQMSFKTCCPTYQGQHNSTLIDMMHHDHTSTDHYPLHPCLGTGIQRSVAPACAPPSPLQNL